MRSKRKDLPRRPRGALALAFWNVGKSELSRITSRINVRTPGLRHSELFLQVYQGRFSTGREQYHGIQTSGYLTDIPPDKRNGLAVFSVFQGKNLAAIGSENVRLGPNAKATVESSEGGFVSVRLALGELEPGHYQTDLRRSEAAAGGDWWDLYVTTPDRKKHHVGGVLVPRDGRGHRSALSNGGASFVEAVANNDKKIWHAVAPWSVDVEVAGDGRFAQSVETSYDQTAPQGNVRCAGRGIRFDVGEAVQRHTPPETSILGARTTARSSGAAVQVGALGV